MEFFTTTSHDEIRTWIESRSGHPASQKAGGHLRVDFGSGEGKFRRITWDEFFQRFDSGNMEFVYQNSTQMGATSRYYRIVDPSEEPLKGPHF